MSEEELHTTITEMISVLWKSFNELNEKLDRIEQSQRQSSMNIEAVYERLDNIEKMLEVLQGSQSLTYDEIMLLKRLIKEMKE